MAYTSTQKIRCWKEHTCAYCQAAFAYKLELEVSGEGKTPEEADREANRIADDTKEYGVEVHPCPTCGMYQLDMVFGRRDSRHGILIVLYGILLFLLLFIKLVNVLPEPATVWLVAGVGGLVALGHIVTQRENINANPLKNQRVAARRVERGILKIVAPGNNRTFDSRLDILPEKQGYDHWMLGLIIAVALIPLGEYWRLIIQAPANNPWRPAVLGPGDEVYHARSRLALQGTF